MTFRITDLGHLASTVFHDIVKGVRVAGTVLNKVTAEGAIIEEVSSLIPGFGPGAVAIERAAFALLGEATKTLGAADAAASVNGVNLTLDQQFVNELKQLIADFKPQLVSAGVIKA